MAAIAQQTDREGESVRLCICAKNIAQMTAQKVPPKIKERTPLTKCCSGKTKSTYPRCTTIEIDRKLNAGNNLQEKIKEEAEKEKAEISRYVQK
jgi:L-asparaginase II